MSLTEAMRYAIEIGVLKEQESFDFYSAAARKVADGALRELFEKLADDELGHREFLRKLLADNRPPMTIKPQPVDYRLAEEAIDKRPDLSVDMPFSDAIALAIKREEEAMMTYQELADEVEDPSMREFFINLRNMEQAHKTTLESVYMNTAFAEVW